MDGFKNYDRDGNGKIEYDEFVEALKQQNLGLSNDQLYELMRSIDKDENNSIDCDEFLKRLEHIKSILLTFLIDFKLLLIELKLKKTTNGYK